MQSGFQSTKGNVTLRLAHLTTLYLDVNSAENDFGLL